jgi:hypothetical protein
MRGEDHRTATDGDSAMTGAEHAAVEATDRGRLLEGEDPETLQVHDADHWIRVYRDLLAFKRNLLSRAREITPRMDQDAQQEVGKTDLVIMDAEAAKLAGRLDFWQRRREELAGG